jgi:CheY-like chemotaxis protein
MHKILVIDDDKITHAFVKRALAKHYAITYTFSGEQGLKELKKNLPEVILLDVEMPGLNGYEVCEQIRSNPDTAEIPVIFFSARGDLRDRMQGFEAGADDYVVKPFHPEEILAKIKVLIQFRLRRHELAKEVDEARKTAFIAISSSSDLGQAISFIEKTHALTNYDQLASAFFVVTQAMDLKCTLMLKTIEGNLFYSSTYNSVSPMESELIANLSTEKRFFDFGARTQINFPHISLLIKNMPLDNMERYGRIKDFFPAMLTTADIKIEQLDSQKAVLEQMEENRQAFDMITRLLNLIKSDLDANQKLGIKIMRNMLMELDRNLPHLGLHETHEQYILDRIDLAIEQAHKAISANQKTNESFESMLESLNDLLTRQHQLQNIFTTPTADEPKNEGEGYQMDVELF